MNPDVVDDGMCEVPFCVAVASVLSQLAPELNPGQKTSYMKWITLESATLSGGTIGPLSLNDYKLFKAAGICAPRRDGTSRLIQSGVTSVDPTTDPNNVPISKRRMYYFVAKSISLATSDMEKKPGTQENRDIVTSIAEGFLERLVQAKRLEKIEVDANALNTASMKALNLFRWKISAQMYGSMDKIAFTTNVGTDVTFEEA